MLGNGGVRQLPSTALTLMKGVSPASRHVVTPVTKAIESCLGFGFFSSNVTGSVGIHKNNEASFHWSVIDFFLNGYF